MKTIENVQAYLTYHTYSEFIIYPYSTVRRDEAWNRDELDIVASKMVQAKAFLMHIINSNFLYFCS